MIFSSTFPTFDGRNSKVNFFFVILAFGFPWTNPLINASVNLILQRKKRTLVPIPLPPCLCRHLPASNRSTMSINPIIAISTVFSDADELLPLSA